MRWKWGNVPVPEVNVVSLVAGIVLHLFKPRRFFPQPWMGYAVGSPVVVAGSALVARAVWAIKDMDIEAPTKLISTGPYALSRNPMYVAWTLINLGTALVVDSIWPVAFLLGVPV